MFILHVCSERYAFDLFKLTVFAQSTNSVSCKEQNLSWLQHCSQVFAHFFFIQFLLHFPFFFLFSHFLVGRMSTQGASVVVVVPTLGSRHSQAIDWTKLDFHRLFIELIFLNLCYIQCDPISSLFLFQENMLHYYAN